MEALEVLQKPSLQRPDEFLCPSSKSFVLREGIDEVGSFVLERGPLTF